LQGEEQEIKVGREGNERRRMLERECMRRGRFLMKLVKVGNQQRQCLGYMMVE